MNYKFIGESSAIIKINQQIAKIAPTMAIPDIAFEPDIKGVCNVGGTLLIISLPTKIAKINTVRILIISIFSFLKKSFIQFIIFPLCVYNEPDTISSFKSNSKFA